MVALSAAGYRCRRCHNTPVSSPDAAAIRQASSEPAGLAHPELLCSPAPRPPDASCPPVSRRSRRWRTWPGWAMQSMITKGSSSSLASRRKLSRLRRWRKVASTITAKPASRLCRASCCSREGLAAHGAAVHSRGSSAGLLRSSGARPNRRLRSTSERMRRRRRPRPVCQPRWTCRCRIPVGDGEESVR